GDVAGADVRGRPAGGQAGAGVEVVVVAEAHGAVALGLECLRGCGGQAGQRGRPGVLARRERVHREGGIAAADQDDAALRGAAHHLGGERGARAERRQRGGGGNQLGRRGGRGGLVRVLRPENPAGGGVGYHGGYPGSERGRGQRGGQGRLQAAVGREVACARAGVQDRGGLADRFGRDRRDLEGGQTGREHPGHGGARRECEHVDHR